MPPINPQPETFPPVPFGKWLLSLRHDLRGATTIEYGIMAAILAIGILGSVSLVGESSVSQYDTLTNAIQGTEPSGDPGVDKGISVRATARDEPETLIDRIGSDLRKTGE